MGSGGGRRKDWSRERIEKRGGNTGGRNTLVRVRIFLSHGAVVYFELLPTISLLLPTPFLLLLSLIGRMIFESLQKRAFQCK